MEYLTLENLGLAVGFVIVLGSTVARVIDLFTNVHPDDDLDETASTIRKWTAKLRQFAGKVGLNSKEDRQ